MAAQVSMTFAVDRRGEVAIVTPSGRITETEAYSLGKELSNLAAQGVIRIILDLGDVAFITSACLGVLMAAHKLCRKAGGGLCVARPQPLVRQILDITKLIKLFGIYDSVDEAIAAK